MSPVKKLGAKLKSKLLLLGQNPKTWFLVWTNNNHLINGSTFVLLMNPDFSRLYRPHCVLFGEEGSSHTDFHSVHTKLLH